MFIRRSIQFCCCYETDHNQFFNNNLIYASAGLKPVEVLRSPTSIPARRFGHTDRGRIASGLKADLLLVKGNPTTNISDTLSILGVWRDGVRLPI